MQDSLNETTIILPSARAIRAEQLSIKDSTLFLPNHITMSEFISKLCIVKNYKTIDNDSRVLLLLEASDFENFLTLKIERNFFTFTKNSSYIFKFYEELSAELYDISTLDTSDIYGEFEEHISILQELYKRYESLCNEKNILDKIFLPKLYEFNENYALSHKKIQLHLDGFLTNFEFELLLKFCEFGEVEIVFNTSAYNLKMQGKFLELGFELEKDYEYTLSLNAREILSQTKSINTTNISCESFSESLLQVAYVQKSIYDFIQKGYKSENIAVILPDEKMAQMLMSFDEKSNFNFAMGSSFTKTKIYEKLNSTCKMIELDSKENEARLDRVGDDLYMTLFKIYYKKSEEVDILKFLNSYKELFSNKTEVKIFSEELYNFKYILPYMKDMSVKSLLNVFLQRIASRTLDDVRGGKITVMGVLETRSVHFDAVVIVDFSDSHVPKRSDKDMFLNTAIREMANLPTMSDRENLQKHYYKMLIKRCKEVAISYVSSRDSSESRFLKQLGIKAKNIYNESDYANIIFSKKEKVLKKQEDIVLPYSFKNVKLSATKLKTYLSCKRKYYYKYIQKIYSHEIPKDMPPEYKIGLDVHDALKELYSKKVSYDNVELLRKDLYIELDRATGKSEFEHYQIELQKRNLVKFCDLEVQRFEQGWRVHRVEENLECRFYGMTLSGQVDRIDKRDNEIFVLDYKTGKYPLYSEKTLDEATDFQLEFYYLLASGFGNVTGCAYYDLKESKIVQEVFLEEKLARLQSIVKDILNIQDINFELCEDEKNCKYCEFKIMCGRE